jgi:hypothetical protein
MKKLIILLGLGFAALTAAAQTTASAGKEQTPTVLKNKVVEIACGECKFKMKGKSCDLAIRIDGKSYFVDGKTVDDFGDAHAKHGFCNAISKAEVTGEIVNDRFKATTIKLLTKQKKG